MRVLHLSEKDATELVVIAVEMLPPNTKAHEHLELWRWIETVEAAFGLVWREDLGKFMRPL